MMKFLHVVVVVLSLLSLGWSAPVTNCDDLLRPIVIQGRDQLLGKWFYVGESTDLPGVKVLTKMFVESIWWNMTAAEENNDIVNFQNQKSFGYCFSLSYNITVEHNQLVMVHPYPASAFLLNTICPDCMVLSSNYTIGGSSYKALQLLSRRTKVSAAELDEFAKQVECLNLPETTIMDPEKGICPDPSISDETRSLDLSSINSDSFNVLDKVLNSKKGIQTMAENLSKLIGFEANTSQD
ncbi:uncharacterized protein LOC119408141 [Nematolebias whitei]|uniref:uncharacterized protein LOC119408141 n=1 Tax=Nematolebias whitei TaxID=451745 RepID=UPI00189B3B5B|nr:uncharacterized protein LOC119408141 [Nematolebias whitei]